MMPHGWRRLRGKRGRLPKPVRLGRTPTVERFIPEPHSGADPIYVDLAEFEALRLVDLEGLSQEEAGERMNVSRGTAWRLLHSARKKVAQAITEARPLLITPQAFFNDVG